MRLGVLDVGSNTVHLMVVDARRGSHPWGKPRDKADHEKAAHHEKTVLRLAERLDQDGRIPAAAADELVALVASARDRAAKHGAVELLAFATSAVREASNCAEVLARVRAEAGIELMVLAGEEEARLTFLAVRRWFGWSAGRLLALDIGGGSVELAAGPDEEPELAASLPLGAGRLTRDWFHADPPPGAEVAELSDYVRHHFAGLTGWGGHDLAAGSSTTLRTLALLARAPGKGPLVLTLSGLHQVFGFLRHLRAAEVGEWDGVSPARAHQLLAGAVVAKEAMEHFEISQLRISPWALREAAVLRRLDTQGFMARLQE